MRGIVNVDAAVASTADVDVAVYVVMFLRCCDTIIWRRRP